MASSGMVICSLALVPAGSVRTLKAGARAQSLGRLRAPARCSSGRSASTSPLTTATLAGGREFQKAPSRSEFRLLLAATTQATVDLQAFEAWSGRFNMICLFGALLSEVLASGSDAGGLFTGFADVDVRTYITLAGAAVLGGAFAAGASNPAMAGSKTLEELTAAWPMRSTFSRSLTTSVLLVEDEEDKNRQFRTVAEDLYKSVLRETLEDVTRSYFPSPQQVQEAPDAQVSMAQIPQHVRSVMEELD